MRRSLGLVPFQAFAQSDEAIVKRCKKYFNNTKNTKIKRVNRITTDWLWNYNRLDWKL